TTDRIALPANAGDSPSVPGQRRPAAPPYPAEGGPVEALRAFPGMHDPRQEPRRGSMTLHALPGWRPSLLADELHRGAAALGRLAPLPGDAGDLEVVVI